jgi:hypothetical protein
MNRSSSSLAPACNSSQVQHRTRTGDPLLTIAIGPLPAFACLARSARDTAGSVRCDARGLLTFTGLVLPHSWPRVRRTRRRQRLPTQAPKTPGWQKGGNMGSGPRRPRVRARAHIPPPPARPQSLYAPPCRAIVCNRSSHADPRAPRGMRVYDHSYEGDLHRADARAAIIIALFWCGMLPRRGRCPYSGPQVPCVPR